MREKREKTIRTVALALGIAILPPIWAVLSPYMGVSVGSVALICAAVYVANGNQRRDAVPIIIGFWLGDLWAVLAMWVMEILPIHPDVELYLTLFALGGAAVLIGGAFPKWIYTPSWLCGWAIGLTVMAKEGLSDIGLLPIETGIAMLVGVVYVGIGVDAFQNWLVKRMVKK